MAEGCLHNQARCEIFAPCCKTYFRCFRCHKQNNETTTASTTTCDTPLDRSKISKIRCTECGLEQKPAKECEGCQISFAEYVCLECSLYRQNDPNGIFHCPDCGICRVGKGLGISHWHCHSCCLCLSIDLVDREKHRKICKMNTIQADCSICFEELHDSQECLVIGYYCGHYLHQSCCDAYFQKSGKIACPICQKPIIRITETKKVLQRISTKVLTAVVGPIVGIAIVIKHAIQSGSFRSVLQAVVLAIMAISIWENVAILLFFVRRRWFVWISAGLLVSVAFFRRPSYGNP
jgi:RING finger/CHY zinc finger protein 1